MQRLFTEGRDVPRRRRQVRVAPLLAAVTLVASLVAIAAAAAVIVLETRPVAELTIPIDRSPSVVTTMAGDGTPALRDGPAWTARFAEPFGVAATAGGDVYVSDAADNNRIRRVTPYGLVVPVAGGAEGFADGVGSAAAFHTPSGIALDHLGNLIVADTGNHAIRRVEPDGRVTTVAGGGVPGDVDGPDLAARFDGPIGVAADAAGRIWVADTYNDRIRLIDARGVVTTVAGSGEPGFADGAAGEAQFDTPSGIAVAPNGDVYVADTGNDAVRRISNGEVTTLDVWPASPAGYEPPLERPVGIAVRHDGVVYVADRRGRIIQLSEGGAAVVAGGGAGSADGEPTRARFNVPAGIAAGPRGELFVADAGNAILRRIGPVPWSTPAAPLSWLPGTGAIGLSAAPPLTAVTPAPVERGYPLLTAEVLRLPLLPWPLDPQEGWHEVAGTLGEPRGSRAGDGRERFHAGLDVRGEEGVIVRAVRDEKVSAPISSSGFGSLSETLSVGAMSYVHVRVGRNRRNVSLDPERFIFVHGLNPRVRVRRGTRFAVGDPIGTVNRFYHVHLEVGLKGMEVNALTLPLVNFVDDLSPTVVPGGIRFFSETGEPLQEKERGRIRVGGRVAIVVDAFDQVEGNVERRKLGLFEVGYQVLTADGTPAPGFETPAITLRFDRLPPDPHAPWIAYADGSGITTYGNRITRFFYIVTNLMRDGRAEEGYWDTSVLPPGDYTVRITARDVRGNEATENTDVEVTVTQ